MQKDVSHKQKIPLRAKTPAPAVLIFHQYNSQSKIEKKI